MFAGCETMCLHFVALQVGQGDNPKNTTQFFLVKSLSQTILSITLEGKNLKKFGGAYLWENERFSLWAPPKEKKISFKCDG